MRTNLLEKRKKMLKMHAQAFPLSLVVNQLSAEYEVSTAAIYKDWHNRGAWQTQLLELGDLPQLCKDLYATHKEIYRMTVTEFLKGDNSNARVGALRLMRDLNLDFVEMFPRVIKTQLKDKRADDLNALLKQYKDIYKNPDDKDKTPLYLVSWGLGDKLPDIRVDARKFPLEKRKIINEACKLINAQREAQIEKERERLLEEARNKGRN